MKAIKWIVFLFFITESLFSQVLWSSHIGSNWVDNDDGILTDNDNNTYFLGFMTGTKILFDNDTIATNANNCMTIAKFNSSGTRVWIKRFDNARITGHIYDKNSNAFILTGVFTYNISLGVYSFSGGGYFLCKMDTSGNFIWARKRKIEGYVITTDSLSNIYTYGYLASPDSLDTIALQPGIFISKYDSVGNVQWAKKMFNVYGVSNSQFKVTPNQLCVFNNEIYVAANTQGDTITIDTTNYFPPYSNSGALMKFTNDGNLEWLRTFGSVGNGGSLAMDIYGSCYLTGGFKGTIHFNADSMLSQNATTYDGFLAKFDSSGHLKWTRQLHATGGGAVLGDIKSDDEGNCYVLSRLSGGTVLFGTFTYTSSGTASMWDNCVARYNSSGDCIGVQQIGITPSGGFGYIDRDNSGNVVAIGYYQNSITLGSTTYGSYGSTDIAIAKLAAITGIGGEDRMANNQLLIYANPTAGKCNITVPDEFLHDKSLTLTIYDNTGRVIQQKALTTIDSKIKLNLEAEAKGIYNVTLTNGVKSYSGKVVFE